MNEQNDKNEISSQRKGLYYTGLVLVVIGIMMFMSTFVLSMMNPFGGNPFINAVIGMIMIMIGNVLMAVGRRGLAGSGIILDPNQAREDLKPYSKQAGGMINDALEEVDVIQNIRDDSQTIKIRCRNCKGLNDENARYCNHCGKEL